MKKVKWTGIIFFVVLLMGCSSENENASRDVLVIYSPHTLEFIDPIISEFENETNITVEIITGGTGELLDRIENEMKDPLGDVLWGGSLSTLESKKTLFDKYIAEANEVSIYKNKDGYITRFTLVPSVIMVNDQLIGDIKIEGYEDLLNEQLKGRIAFADPMKSSSSYEQLINQLWDFRVDSMEDGWGYVEKLLVNMDGILLDSSKDVYNGVVSGEFFVGLTFEDAAAKFVRNGAPVSIVYPKEGTIIRPDGVSVIKGTKHKEYAQQFIEFVTSYETQVFIVNELNGRSIRNDVEPVSGLQSLATIYTVEDDQQWSSDNKVVILDRFTSLFKELYEK